jgi:hypothetical protein
MLAISFTPTLYTPPPSHLQRTSFGEHDSIGKAAELAKEFYKLVGEKRYWNQYVKIFRSDNYNVLSVIEDPNNQQKIYCIFIDEGTVYPMVRYPNCRPLENASHIVQLLEDALPDLKKLLSE